MYDVPSYKLNKYYKGLNDDGSLLIFQVIKIINKKQHVIKVKILRDDDRSKYQYSDNLVLTLYFNCDQIPLGKYFTKAKQMDDANALALMI